MIELLVVIVIIAIVASIGSNTYQSQQRIVKYNDSIVKVNEMIKTARNYAVTSTSYWDGSNNIVPTEGYGIYIEHSSTPGQSRIVLFANTDSSTDSEQGRTRYYPPGDILLEEYFLPTDTNFVGLSIDQDSPTHTAIGGGSTDNEVTITFKPPLAEAFLTPNDTPIQPVISLANLYLEFQRPDAPPEVPSKYIHINKIAGFSEVES